MVLTFDWKYNCLLAKVLQTSHNEDHTMWKFMLYLWTKRSPLFDFIDSNVWIFCFPKAINYLVHKSLRMTQVFPHFWWTVLFSVERHKFILYLSQNTTGESRAVRYNHCYMNCHRKSFYSISCQTAWMQPFRIHKCWPGCERWEGHLPQIPPLSCKLHCFISCKYCDHFQICSNYILDI